MYFFSRSEIDERMGAELAEYDRHVGTRVGAGYRWPLRMRDWELAQVMRALPAPVPGGDRRLRVLETGAYNTFLGLWLDRLDAEVVVSDIYGARLRKNLLRRVGLAAKKPAEARFESWWRRMRPHVQLRSVDLTDIPYVDGRFDLITSVSVIEHIPDCAAALAEMIRVLAPGGRLLMTTDIAEEGKPYADGVRFFSLTELNELCAPYQVTSIRRAPDFDQANWCYGRGEPVTVGFVEITRPL
jgi:SAM-dependent methyltransferase